MNYFKIDINRLIKSKQVIVVVMLLLAIAIIDPITVSMYFSKDIGTAKTIGQNPFQFWMLMNSVSWGNNLYNIMFWILATLLTGLIYYEDKNTSMYMYQIIRKGKSKYLISKFFSTGLFSFILILLVLEINILVTYMLFPDTTVMTDYYDRLVPHEGSFVYKAFLSNPINATQIYSLLNALAMSIFVVFAQCISMLFKISIRYVALLIPVIILYGINFIFDSFPGLFAYNIRMILQPRAVSALTTIITWENVIVVMGGWIVVNLILISVIFLKSRNCYE
ncbi:hypothetical protein [Paenibacillus alba]|uniref:ABC transporter permease n=1 Tax=Paenibacillus alba TaxID=1197127 RepID=A0ABU6G750_9BACL|nr:hypothetical protein [Paenibacillus alba]MEC0229092.1 hypothetical protein [Paenibacillus alba]